VSALELGTRVRIIACDYGVRVPQPVVGTEGIVIECPRPNDPESTAFTWVRVDKPPGRFHPFYFYQSPLPGPLSVVNPTRYKSKGHHAGGFEDEEEGWKSARVILDHLEGEHAGDVKLIETLEEDEWGEDETPARVRFAPSGACS